MNTEKGFQVDADTMRPSVDQIDQPIRDWAQSINLETHILKLVNYKVIILEAENSSTNFSLNRLN